MPSNRTVRMLIYDFYFNIHIECMICLDNKIEYLETNQNNHYLPMCNNRSYTLSYMRLTYEVPSVYSKNQF